LKNENHDNKSQSSNQVSALQQILAESARKWYSHPIFTEGALVMIQMPDFSMPFNVVCLASTVLTLFFSLLFKKSVRRDPDEANVWRQEATAAGITVGDEKGEGGGENGEDGDGGDNSGKSGGLLKRLCRRTKKENAHADDGQGENEVVQENGGEKVEA
jgi:hypothetical protein